MYNLILILESLLNRLQEIFTLIDSSSPSILSNHRVCFDFNPALWIDDINRHLFFIHQNHPQLTPCYITIIRLLSRIQVRTSNFTVLVNNNFVTTTNYVVEVTANNSVILAIYIRQVILIIR